MSKTLLEIFSRYTPDDAAKEILLLADPESIKLRADKPQRIVEVNKKYFVLFHATHQRTWTTM